MLEYIVPISCNDDLARGTVLAYSQGIMPFNKCGSPDGWVFSQEVVRGKSSLVVRTSSKETADLATRGFHRIPGVVVERTIAEAA